MFTETDIDDYQSRLTEEDKKHLLNHCNEFEIAPVICAWYDNLDDFFEDWVDHVGYTKETSALMLANNRDEFKQFKDGRIVRLES